MRMYRALSGIGAVLAFTLIAGCGSSDSAAGAPSTTIAAPTTTTVQTTVSATAAAATSARPTPAPMNQVQAELTMQGGPLGLLTLTNTGSRKLTVKGWPMLTFLDAANDRLSVPIQQVAVPGAGPSIGLATGRTAFAGVTWVIGNKADDSTFVATTVQLTPPGGGTPTVVTVIGTDGQPDPAPEFDLTSVKVGTWQPASQGVLTF